MRPELPPHSGGTVGIDIDSRNLTVAILAPRQLEPSIQKLRRNADDIGRLIDLLSKNGARDYLIGLDIGTDGFRLPRALASCGVTCLVIRSDSVRREFRGRKTDRVDARLIAKQLQNGGLLYVTVPDQTTESARSMIRLKRKRMAELQGMRREINDRVMKRGLMAPRALTPWTDEHRRWLGSIRTGDLVFDSTLAVMLDGEKAAHASLSRLESELSMIAASPRYLRFRNAMKHLGGDLPLSALEIALECHTPDRFTGQGELVAFAGLDLVENQSGTVRRRRKVTKQGRAGLRDALHAYAELVIQTADRTFPLTERDTDPVAEFVRTARMDMISHLKRRRNQGVKTPMIRTELAGILAAHLLPVLKISFPPAGEGAA